MPTRKQQAYARKLNEIFTRYDRVENDTIRAMTASLQELRKNIGATLANIDPESFQAFQLQQIQRNIDGHIADFSRALTTKMSGSLEEIYNLGDASAYEPLLAAGIKLDLIGMDVSQINAITGFSADLIQDISGPMRQSINTQLRLSALGGQSPYKAMRAITDILGIKAQDGVWGPPRRPEVVKGVAARAEAIFRTEMTRTANIAIHSRQRSVAERNPEVRKTWIATGDSRTRITHLQAHVKYNDEPIPVNQSFLVGSAELMYPGDPAGPASETVYCRCRSTTIHPEIGLVPGPEDERIRREVGRRK